MSDAIRSNLSQRRYRLAQALTVAGSLSVGTLVVNRLVSIFRDDFFLYYGVSDHQYQALQDAASGQVPLTVGQLMVAGIALLAVCWFVWAERRRVRQSIEIGAACRDKCTEVVESRLSLTSLFDLFVARASSFAGVLLALWLLQSCLERWLGGFGWGMEYADWRSLLPLASIFGVCVLAGMLVALVSMVGLRTINVLELVLASIKARRRKPLKVVVTYGVNEAARTIRELLGCDILSRPPPLSAVV